MMGRMKRGQMKNSCHADVIIVGGGLSGLTLAGLLARGGVRVICLDRDPPATQLAETFDGRTTAISYGSRQILDEAGVWAMLEDEGDGACAIECIQILDGLSHRVDLEFRSAEAEGRVFGWIVENKDFRKSLYRNALALKTLQHVAPAAVKTIAIGESNATATTESGDIYTASLIVGADGRNSAVRALAGIGTRGWSYGQQAVICTVTHEKPHRHIAVEHFRSEGPFAILPMTNDATGRHRSSVVWTVEQARGASPLDWPVDVFEAGLMARFPAWYGRVALAGRRFAYPLGLVHAYRYTAARTALVADAAHGIHPIAGQGLNLGMRDVAALARRVIAAVKDGADPGGADVLKAYERDRRMDNMAMAGATDLLNHLFSNDIGPIGMLRRTGLRGVARIPAAKRFFMGQAMGLAPLKKTGG